MRTFAVLAVLLALACGGGPKPEDVAGVYDLYSLNGEVYDWEGQPPALFFELDPDGTFSYGQIMNRDGRNFSQGDTMGTQGIYTVSEGEDGCVAAVFRRPERPDETERVGFICGDTLMFVGEVEGEQYEQAWIRRR